MFQKTVIFFLEKQYWITIIETDYHEYCVTDFSKPKQFACKGILVKIHEQMKG